MNKPIDKGSNPGANHVGDFCRYNLTNAQKKNIMDELAEALKQVEEIRFAFLHGSFLQNASFRDIDIAVYLEDKLANNEGVDICSRLSVKLTDKLGVSVDVNLLNTASLGFCYHAVQGQILVYRQLEEVYQYKEDIFIKYMDFYPFIKENLADLLR